MGVNRVTKRGKARIEVRRRWPDGTTFRRYYPNMTLARNTLTRIESSILDGSWQELRRELTGEADGADQVPETMQLQPTTTIREFSQHFLEDRKVSAPKSWDRYALSLRTLNQSLGDVALDDFRRGLLDDYVQRRLKKVSRGTVNRDIACLRALFSYAVESEILTADPLAKYKLLKTDETVRSVLTVGQFRSLVDQMDRLPIAAMTALLGETGMRKGEALALRWDDIRWPDRTVRLQHTKNGKVRFVPLSDYSTEWLQRLVRYVGCPYVFVNPRRAKRWINPEQAFKRGAEATGLSWVGFHDLRRFRACQWVRLGLDLETIMKLLGHSDLRTTQLYVKGLEPHLEKVRKLQDREAEWETNGRHRHFAAAQGEPESP